MDFWCKFVLCADEQYNDGGHRFIFSCRGNDGDSAKTAGSEPEAFWDIDSNHGQGARTETAEPGI